MAVRHPSKVEMPVRFRYPAPPPTMFYVYILKSKTDGLLYIGSTPDLKRRFDEHNKGLVKSTRPRKPFALIYYEAYIAEKDARLRESRLKNYKRAYNQLKTRIANCLKET